MSSSTNPLTLPHATAERDPAGVRSPSRVPGWLRIAGLVALVTGVLVILAVLVWQAIAAGGSPNPEAAGSSATARVIDIGVLVFREGLEAVLVLAAVTASFVGGSARYSRSIGFGVGAGIVATLATWFIAVGIMNSLTTSVSALHLQAITGLLAIVVLLVVMNWFFHKVYWSGWISLHTRRKRALLDAAAEPGTSTARVLWGFALLGFTSLYREGFEVVLFLQSYRLRLGNSPVLAGVLVGVLLTSVVAVLTFVAHHRLPYKKMLVATGVMLGFVLLVMVGEQAQEMQLAHWLPTTTIPSLARVLPDWAGLWFGVSPTVETLVAQALAALAVLGSYGVVQRQLVRARRGADAQPTGRTV